MSSELAIRSEVLRHRASILVTARANDPRSLRRRGRTLWRLGTLHFRLGEFEKAASYSGEAADILRSQPAEWTIALYARGRQAAALFQLGRHEETVTCLDMVISSRSEVLELLGRKTPKGVRWEDSIADLLALKIAAFNRLGRKDDADVAAGLVIEGFGNGGTRQQRLLVAQALVTRGRRARSKGDTENALAALEDASRRCAAVENSDFALTYCNAVLERGALLDELGNAEGALAAYREVANRFASASEPWLQEAVESATRLRTELTARAGSNPQSD